MKKINYLIFSLFILIISCARHPLLKIEDSMRPISNIPALVDDYSDESFIHALKNHIEGFKKTTLVKDPLTFGTKKISKADYLASLEKILQNQNDWKTYITNNFDFYEVYGRDDYAEVMVTGYYEPIVGGSHFETALYSQAIYSTPTDLVTVDLKKFYLKFENNQSLPQIVGQLVENTLRPYFTRKEIDTDKKLANKMLELYWVKPIDAFFIQIQGSGVIELENGEKVRVGYDAQNGHPYQAIGKSLTHIIPMSEMSMQRIRLHLETLSKEEQQKIFNFNPSYVFFKKLEGLALTYTGMEVSEGRTIATDKEFFPKGAMAFLDVEEPVFESLDEITPKAWIKKPRLVFDQDTGGAIKGGGRVDLYIGSGESAHQIAGVMRHPGKLFYLVPKN